MMINDDDDDDDDEEEEEEEVGFMNMLCTNQRVNKLHQALTVMPQDTSGKHTIHFHLKEISVFSVCEHLHKK